MTTQWRLHTHGDPLRAARLFLGRVWSQAGLKGMLVPMRTHAPAGMMPLVVADPAQLNEADPFAPLMTAHAALLASFVARASRAGPVGAVLRPCEARALNILAHRSGLAPNRLMLIGVDCLGTFPQEDYGWRVEKHGVDRVTHDSLQFARQGGILAYRNRVACQMCTSATPESVDLHLDFVGLPVHQVMLITARDERVSNSLRLAAITDGPADPALVAQHEERRGLVMQSRSRTRNRIIQALPASLPQEVEELAAYFKNCAPCRQCLKACPTYTGELTPRNGQTASLAAVSRWLSTCVGCGLCEEACPRHIPLSAIMNRVSWTMLGEWLAA